MLRPRPHNPFPRPAYMSKNPTHHRVVSPKATHFRDATCREVDCEKYLLGWSQTLPAHDDNVNWIRFVLTGYHFTERSEIRLVPDLRDGHEGEFIAEPTVIFTFPAGQPCFRQGHKVTLERTPFFYKGSLGNIERSVLGDHRIRVRQEPLEWMDNLGNKLVRGKW